MVQISSLKPAQSKNPGIYLKAIETGDLTKYEPTPFTNTALTALDLTTPKNIDVSAIPYEIRTGEWLSFEDSTTGQISLVKVTETAAAAATSITGIVYQAIPAGAIAVYPTPILLMSAYEKSKDVSTEEVDHFSTISAIQLSGQETKSLSLSGYWSPLSASYRTMDEGKPGQEYYLRIEGDKQFSSSTTPQIDHYQITVGSTSQSFDKNSPVTDSLEVAVLNHTTDYEG